MIKTKGPDVRPTQGVSILRYLTVYLRHFLFYQLTPTWPTWWRGAGTQRDGWLLYGEEVSAIRILFIKTTSSNAKSKVSFENRKCHTIHTPCLQSWQFVYFKIKFCIYLRSYICWQFWFCKSESIIHGRRDRRRVESLEPLTQRFTTLLAAFCMEILT